MVTVSGRGLRCLRTYVSSGNSFAETDMDINNGISALTWLTIIAY